MHAGSDTHIARDTGSLLFFTGCVLAAVLLVRHAAVPLWRSARATDAELAGYRRIMSSGDAAGSIQRQIISTRESLDAKLDELSAGLGNLGDLSALLQMLIEKARESDIRFVKMLPQAEQPGADFVRYPVLLETATTYRSLGGFIAALEALPHMVRIDRIAVSASADDKISVKILVTCFLQPGE